jgi:predicted permease
MAFIQIISDNIMPLLVFVAIGYVLDMKFTIDVKSLTRLTFFIVLPSLIFYSIYSADIDMSMVTVFLFAFVEMVVIGAIAWCIGRLRHMDVGKIEALKNGTMFSNTGNIGIALVALVFSNPPFVVHGTTPYLIPAVCASTMVLIQMNLFLNTLGLYQAGRGALTPRDTLSVIFHMPVVYILVSVFLVKYFNFPMEKTFIWPVFQYSAQALVSIVMMTLGIQIRHSHITLGDMDAWFGVGLRLLGAPLITFIMLTLWNHLGTGFSPVVCQVLLIMSCVPSAVNSVMYALEFDNYVDFATEIVMLSTFLSVGTMTLVIFGARILFPVG